jgi:hypothetical protein
MLKIDSDKEALNECLNSFIWTFKIGDNILYNLNIIFQLIEGHNKLEKRDYAKPISILCVSIVEAVLVDFLERLESATKHFPSKLDSEKSEIKNHLNREKSNFQTTYEGRILKYKRLRNFGYSELIEFCEEFNILGSKSNTYKELKKLGLFRNRVHIRNYFGNFERNESSTFSEARTQKTIDYMETLFKYFKENYPRP